ncbi:unnamed protein product [Dracunculus medinensis]|uniref:Large ribosomal subunit protein uL11m n=1 Tax=Dracunculus medinensis TaxID=318479 RepID=A0A0N4UJ04_DRAME|nr:unnamed protein product [Dracunculus medinensis]
MASKIGGKLRKKEVVKRVQSAFLKTNIKAQLASAAPPLGAKLGNRGINVANFCSQFNKETAHIKPGTNLPTRIYIKPDRTFDLEISPPTGTWLLMKAAGIGRGSQRPDNYDIVEEFAGRISVKHIYEIAKVKSQDKMLTGVPLKDVCRYLIRQSLSIGIEVVREDMDPVEYRKFLEERQKIVEEQLQFHAEKKATKMLRAA